MRPCLFLAMYSALTVGMAVHGLDLKTEAKKMDGHWVLDMRPVFNNSCFDDGVADNREGGWTDEGMNDFHCYPALDFKAKKHRGYFFDFVDPASNNGKNLLMTGMDEYWPEQPRKFRLSGFRVKGAQFFMMHTEGRFQKKDADAVYGKLVLEYADGTRAERELRYGLELADWYQGRWWNNCELAREDAPEILKKSKCNPDEYKKLGGTDFHEAVLKHADAVRWPVTQGLNKVSSNWSIPVVFWALTWAHPHPEREIVAIEIESAGKCLIGIAGITVTDEDFSLDRQEAGEMRKPDSPPVGYFEQIAAETGGDKLQEIMLSKPWTKGIRDVQIRSDKIVTVRVDHIANFANLQKATGFKVTSVDDPEFRDGVTPVKVDRFSRASRYREVQPNQLQILSDHWLHLRLPKKLKSGKNYRVEVNEQIMPTDNRLTRSVDFSLDKTANPSFKINQVGYSALTGIKLAYLSSYLGDGEPVSLDKFAKFAICRETDGETVFEGNIVKVSDQDTQGMDRLYLLDFSRFNGDGKFHIRVDGLGRSYPFKVGNSAAREIYDICHRGMFFQRAGIEIKEPYAGKWPRPMAHDKIWVTQENTTHPDHSHRPFDPRNKKEAGQYYLPGGPKKIHGGHYDAGDFDLRAMHIIVPSLFLTLYEACPEKFYDGQVLIPENNNGIPDLLDEAAWNLLSLEYIQDYATEIRGLDGGVAPGYESYAHPASGMGHEDNLPYYMRKVTGYFSLCAAANFAQAARLFKPFDKAKSARYLERAERAYRYGITHRDEPQPKMPNGKVDQGEAWNPGQFKGAITWAAGQLFATTGNMKYWNDFKDNYKHMNSGVAGAVPYWSLVWGILGTDVDIPEPAVRKELREKLIREADGKLAEIEGISRNGYRAATPKGGGWGNTSCIPRNAEAATRAWMLTREQKYLDAVATCVDFTLGMNPSEISWMTGAGTVYPMDPCSHNSTYDGEEEPLPGILIYGPTNYWYDSKVQLYPDKKNMGFYRRVVDAWGMIAQCEYTVWETQAPFLFAAGILIPGKNTSDK